MFLERPCEGNNLDMFKRQPAVWLGRSEPRGEEMMLETSPGQVPGGLQAQVKTEMYPRPDD